MKSQKAFTVLELVMILAIIAILISLTLFAFRSAKKNLNEKVELQKLQTVQTIVEQYRAVCRTYPNSLDPNTANSLAGGNACTSTLGSFDLPDMTGIVYTPLRRVGNVTTSACDSYHIGVTLDPDSNELTLPDDKDWDITANTVYWEKCDVNSAVISPLDPVYDVTGPGV